MDKDIVAILIFGVVVLAGLAALQWKRVSMGGRFSLNFLKGYGLILVATLGAALALSDAPKADKTGAFTLLGTIAGYLAGAKVTSGDDGDELTKDGIQSPRDPDLG
jgi:cytochrome c biogenesis factor